MYSPLIVDKSLFALKKAGHKVNPRSVSDSQEISRKLDKLLNSEGTLSRNLTSNEAEFVRSETMLCRSDFNYWALRYGHIERDAKDGGGVAPIVYWAGQERTLELMAHREEEIYKEYDKTGFSDGILLVWHKCRQEGATALGRLISNHRMTLFKSTRCFAASLDETKIHELYVRDTVILDNLPFYLKPEIEFNVKDEHIGLKILKSRLTYQKANQQAGVGTGQQFDMSHGTEIALWPAAERLQFDFFPAVPQSPRVFLGLESTANGRDGFWYEFTENVRLRRDGYGHWTYSFTPWYIEPTKYRRSPYDGWVPSQVSIEHADMVERTSPEYVGRKMVLNPEQLYWWETERELYRKNDALHVFLTNYCATPEQSFQHSTRSALPIDTIEWMRTNALLGMPYMAELSRQRV
jgi:hypothetical protein